uniref:Uncharacterized protein n=1 Tax=Oryza brachyantha TaxID=4533 RepID=J3MZH9_ORYBR
MVTHGCMALVGLPISGCQLVQQYAETTVGRLSCLLITASQSVSNYRPEEVDSLTDRIGMADTRPCLAAVARRGFPPPGRRRTKHVPRLPSGHTAERACFAPASTVYVDRPPLVLQGHWLHVQLRVAGLHLPLLSLSLGRRAGLAWFVADGMVDGIIA